MSTPFDFLFVALFIAVAATFFFRLQREDPPLAPYVMICLICAVGNWLGNNAANAAAIGLLIAGALWATHLAAKKFPDTDSGY